MLSFWLHALGVLVVLCFQHLGVLTVSPAFLPREQQKFLGVLNPKIQSPHLWIKKNLSTIAGRPHATVGHRSSSSRWCLGTPLTWIAHMGWICLGLLGAYAQCNFVEVCPDIYIPGQNSWCSPLYLGFLKTWCIQSRPKRLIFFAWAK